MIRRRCGFAFVLLFLLALAFAAAACSGSSSSNSTDDDATADDDASPADDDDDASPEKAVPTTLDVTFAPKETSPGSGKYELAQFAGEPYMARNDLNIKPSRDAAGKKPLSMTYFATFSDLHVADEESPARLTFFDSNIILDGVFESAYRPQEDLAGQLLNSLVRTNDRVQSDYGRDYDFALVLGDGTDSSQTNELKTVIDIFDAKGLLSGEPGWARVDSGDLDIDPKTGHDRGERNFGVQETNDQGENINPYNRPGYPNSNADFPTPGLVRASGKPVPWFYTMGNHDEENCGALEMFSPLTFYKPEDYVSSRSAFGYLPGLANLVQYWKENPNQELHIGLGFFRVDLDWRIIMNVAQAAGMIPDDYTKELNPNFDLMKLLHNTPALASDDGVEITADPERAWLGRTGVMGLIEPLGHGFSDRPAADFGYYRLDWQKIDPASQLPLRILTLDSTELENVMNGGLSDAQMTWLSTELDQAAADEMLVIVTTHFNLGGIDKNGAELQALLAGRPNVILLLEGHGHDNVVAAWPGTGGSPGFWEIQTPSVIDFPQQSRIFEIVDNRDGTGTAYVTLVDHWITVSDDADTLANLGRELAFEDRLAKGWDGKTPFGGMGQLKDRNVALTFAIPPAIADKLAQIPSDGSITSLDSLGHLYHQ